MKANLPKIAFWLTFLLPLGLGYVLTGYPLYWNKPLRADFLIWLGVFSLVAWLLKLTGGRRAPQIGFCLFLIYFSIGVGVLPLSATCLFFASAVETGRLALGWLYRGGRAKSTESENLATGLVILIAIFSAITHFPVSSRLLYLVILVTPLFLSAIGGGMRGLKRLTNLWAGASRWAKSVPPPALIISLAFITWVLRLAFIPSVNYDDNVTHLRLWTDLNHLGYAPYDVVQMVWAVAPMAVDLMHAVVALVAGGDSRGALNPAITLIMLWHLAATMGKLGLRSSFQLLLLCLFVSTPLTAQLMFSLQTELFLGCLGAVGIWLVISHDTDLTGPATVALLSVASLAAATKVPGVVLGVMLIIAGALRLRFLPWASAEKRSLNPLAMALIFCAGLFTAIHSYLNALILTGNPFFPLYNEIFKSAYYPNINFADLRWMKGFGLSTYVDAFFHTSEHMEARNHVAGYQYLLVLPISLVALMSRRVNRWILLAALVMVGFGVPMYMGSQYWRYLYPAMPLATLVSAVLLTGKNDAFRGAMTGIMSACLALNVFYLPGVYWVMKEAPPQRVYTERGKQALRKYVMPTAVLSEMINHDAMGARVLYPPDKPLGALLYGDPLYVNWYSWKRNMRFEKIAGLDDAARFIDDERADYAILDRQIRLKPNTPEALLGEQVALAATPLYELNGLTAYRLGGPKPVYREVLSLGESMAAPFSNTAQGHLVDRRLDAGHAGAVRYTVAYRCATTEGGLTVAFSREGSPVYPRQLECVTEPVSFTEAILLPGDSGEVEIIVGVLDAGKPELLTLEAEVM